VGEVRSLWAGVRFAPPLEGVRQRPRKPGFAGAEALARGAVPPPENALIANLIERIRAL
jgi:hypothetical protein